MPVVRAAARDNVDNAAGCVSEFRLVAASDNLKFKNRILVELRRRAAIEVVAVWQAVDQEEGIAAALAKNRGSVVAGRVGLTIQRHSWNELQKIQIVAAVDGHVFDLLRSDGAAGRGSRRFKEWCCGIDFHGLIQRPHLHGDVEIHSPIQRDFEVFEDFRLKAVLGGPNFINAGRQTRDAVTAVALGGGGAIHGQCSACRADLDAGNGKALLVLHGTLDRGSGLRRDSEPGKKHKESQATGINHRMLPNPLRAGTTPS